MGLRFLALITISTLFTASFSAPVFAKQHIITRADFAKALAKQIDIKTNSVGCYKDAKSKTKTNKLICGLKRAGALEDSKKIYPRAKLKWNFAIQSLCRARNWTAPTTFANCAHYARENKILTEPLPEKPAARDAVEPKQLAALLAKSFRAKDAPYMAPLSQAPTAPEQKQQPAEQVLSALPTAPATVRNFTPAALTNVSKDFFSNVILSQNFSNHFYLNEVYSFEGELLNSSAEDVFVFMCETDKSCDDSKKFLEKTNGRSFKIPVIFNKAGNFELGIIPGRSGSSRVASISVLPEVPQPAGSGSAPTQLAVAYDKGKTAFSWNGAGATTRLSIFQSDVRKDYLFRQQVQSFSPPSEDFASFKKGAAGWMVEVDGAQSPVQQISLTTRDFRKIDSSALEILELAEVFTRPSRFVFRARAKSPIAKKTAVTRPAGDVEEIVFADVNIQPQQEFIFEMEMPSPGTYIFEINTPEGAAVVNLPVYVGGEVPLLPDFFTLNPGVLSATPITNLDQERETMLQLINNDRRANGLQPVVIWSELNTVAQTHSQNMLSLNFFGHVNPSGNGPDDRRKAANIPVSVKENLGKATSLPLVEAGLMRSPIHRLALLDPTAKRIGIGIVKNQEGYFIVTQNFATDPLQPSDLARIENEFLMKMNEVRAQKNMPNLSRSPALDEIAKEWSAKMAKEGFFSSVDGQGVTLVSRIRSRGINTSVALNIVQGGSSAKIIEEISKQSSLSEPSVGKVGIGIALNGLGELFATILYTP